MSVLEIKNLHVSVETEQGTKYILKGVDLSIAEGETHAIMGPNGSGKSTLAYTIAGHPKYHVDSGSIMLDGVEMLKLTVDARARAGLFLAMQYRWRSPASASPTSCAPRRHRSMAKRRPFAAGSSKCASP